MELFTLLAPVIIGALTISTLKYRAAYINATTASEVSDSDFESIELAQSKLQLLNYYDATNVGLSD